jgi:hypothetical protein
MMNGDPVCRSSSTYVSHYQEIFLEGSQKNHAILIQYQAKIQKQILYLLFIMDQIHAVNRSGKLQGRACYQSIWWGIATSKKCVNLYRKLKATRLLLDRLEQSNHFRIYSDSSIKKGEDVRNMVKYLFTEARLSFQMLTHQSLHAIFIKRNPVLLQAAIQEMQLVSRMICQRLNEPFKNETQAKLVEILLGNILAIYPFLEPVDKQELQIPQKIDSKWQMVRYRVDRLQLTPSYLGDPFYSYGLKPLDATLPVQSLLLFMGTPLHPTARGGLLGRWTDMTPGYTVGESIYDFFSRSLIQEWIKEAFDSCQDPQKGVKLYGASLGGSLCLIAASHQPQYVSEVHAYVPPAPLSYILQTYQRNCGIWAVEPDVNVYRQENDIASWVGRGWDLNWKVWMLQAPQKFNFVEAHIKAFAGITHVTLSRINQKEENDSLKRKLSCISLEILKIPFFGLSSLHLGYRSLSILSKKWIKKTGIPSQVVNG